MRRVSFNRLAERELNDTALYYASESPGLGIKFLDEIEHYIDGIRILAIMNLKRKPNYWVGRS